MYLEIAKGSPSGRGILIPKSELAEYIVPEIPLYRSVYGYTEDILKYKEETGSVKNYFGERSIDNVPIDIDKKDYKI